MINSNIAGNPVIWIEPDAETPVRFDVSVGALLAVPQSEADAEEPKRPKRTARKR